MKRGSNVVIAAILLLWLGGTGYGFWWFEGRYLRPVDRPLGASTARPERQLPPPLPVLKSEFGTVSLSGAEPVTVLNFWNPNCPCSRYAEPDVRALIEKYGKTGVRFVTVIAAGDGDVDGAYCSWQSRGIRGTAPVADIGNKIAMKFGVWAAPAAVILNSQGRVEYVGAYNAARFCNNPATAWAAHALSSIVQGKTPKIAKTLFFGCQLNAAAG